MVAAAGAGPSPIPHKELTVDVLAEGIRYCLSDRATTAASIMAAKMNAEAGVSAAVSSFHRNLPLDRLRCDLYPGQPAVWTYSRKGRKWKLSKIAAQILVAEGIIDQKNLNMYVDILEASASGALPSATNLYFFKTGMPSTQF
jgi:hypothetical protein